MSGTWLRAALGGVVVTVMVLLSIAARAQDRIALVIGNDRYPNLPADKQLAKAVNDARAIGDSLTKIGFTVIRGENLDRQSMIDRIFEFTQKIKPGDTAVLFYAGHGVAIAGGNYLLPSDVRLAGVGEESRVRNMAIGEADVIADIQERKAKVTVLMLDACRDNPFRQPGLTRSVGGEQGLSRGQEAEGIFAIYSAGFNQSALDNLGPADKSPNSVFTRVLAPALLRPNVHLGDLMIDVRQEVAQLAGTINHQQYPAYYDQTRGGRIYLAPRLAAVTPVVTAPPSTAFQAPAPDRLGRVWQEVEQGWTGVWSRRGRSSTYDARWVHPRHGQVLANLDIVVDGNVVAIVRNDGGGNPCAYFGALAADGTVSGTYGCSPTNIWSARIEGATAANPLGQVWRDEEAGWSGVWRRRGNGPTFDANWTHPSGGKVNGSTIVITLNDTIVTIDRRDGSGARCQYAGVLGRDGKSVNGTYRCIEKGALTWSATIDGATAANPLGLAWRDEEQGWTGIWKRRGASWTFEANWSRPDGGRVLGSTLVISIVNRNVAINRTDVSGAHCLYAGTLAADGNSVAGSYFCDGAHTGWTWRATIEQ